MSERGAKGLPVHDPHVIKKQRDGGTRHGEVTYYAVGWQRSTLAQARNDLRRFRIASGEDFSEQVAPLRARIAELEGKLAELHRAAETYLLVNDPEDEVVQAARQELQSALTALPASAQALTRLVGAAEGARDMIFAPPPDLGWSDAESDYELEILRDRVDEWRAARSGRGEGE